MSDWSREVDDNRIHVYIVAHEVSNEQLAFVKLYL